MEKANVTLYTVIGDSNRIVEAIRERFKEMTKEFVCEDETIDLTLPDGTHVIFSIKHRMSKPDFIASHISGMANYFSQVKTPLVGLKENVLLQIRVFNCVTGITFDLNDNEDRTNYILNRLFEIAGDVNGFLLYPSMQIFTGEGKLLFSAKGESQLTEFIPVGNADLLDGNYQEETQADVERRLRSIALLEEKHIPYMEYLRSEAERRWCNVPPRCLLLLSIRKSCFREVRDGKKPCSILIRWNSCTRWNLTCHRPKLLISIILIRKNRNVFCSDGAMNVPVFCFGRQVLWMICLIRLRLLMSLFWLLFSGNIKVSVDCFRKVSLVRSPKYWMLPILHFGMIGLVWKHEFMEKKLLLR